MKFLWPTGRIFQEMKHLRIFKTMLACSEVANEKVCFPTGNVLVDPFLSISTNLCSILPFTVPINKCNVNSQMWCNVDSQMVIIATR